MRTVHVLPMLPLLVLVTGCISTNDIVFEDSAPPGDDDSGAAVDEDTARSYPRDDAPPRGEVGADPIDGSATADSATPLPPPGGKAKAPEIGSGDHSASSVTLTEIAGAAQSLKNPRDVAFNPRRPDELWIVNHDDESVAIVTAASTAKHTYYHRIDAMAEHFMARVTSLAFGADETSFGIPGTFASCGESRNTYDGTSPADDFMGPTLWSSDLSIFAVKDPHGLGSHLDMLHVAPLCMGIEHQEANVYWTFAGVANAIVKFDFRKDHGIGMDDHSDGAAYRYVKGQMHYVAGVPSGLFYHPSDGMLFIADPGAGRVVKLDTKSGTKGSALATKDSSEFWEMTGATLVDVVAAATGLLKRPSGLEMKNELIFVADDDNGRISAFTTTGDRVNWLDTGLAKGSLGGMAFGPDGKLYFADRLGNKVFRIDPK